MEEKGKKVESNWKVVFWNVTELGNEYNEFWGKLGDWEVMFLLETWMEKKRWRKIKSKLPKEYD